MPDISAIAAMLSSIKTANDLINILKDTNQSFKEAEWKMK